MHIRPFQLNSSKYAQSSLSSQFVTFKSICPFMYFLPCSSIRFVKVYSSHSSQFELSSLLAFSSTFVPIMSIRPFDVHPSRQVHSSLLSTFVPFNSNLIFVQSICSVKCLCAVHVYSIDSGPSISCKSNPPFQVQSSRHVHSSR